MATTVHNLVYFDKLIVTCSVSMRPFSVSEIAHKTSLKALSALYNSANSFARNSAKSMTGLHCCTPLHQAVLHYAKKNQLAALQSCAECGSDNDPQNEVAQLAILCFCASRAAPCFIASEIVKFDGKV